MDDDPDLLNYQSILISMMLAADGELSAPQIEMAGLILVQAFGLLKDEAHAKLEETCSAVGAENSEQIPMLMASCVEKIRASISPEGRQSLYNQLDAIAKCDGLKDSEAELLSIIRDAWQVKEGVFEETVKRALDQKGPCGAASVPKSGCLLLMALGTFIFYLV